MAIEVSCVDCCVGLKFPDSMAGREVRCHVCDAVFVAPGAAATAVPEVEPVRVPDVEPVRVPVVEPVRVPATEEEGPTARPVRFDREPQPVAAEPVRESRAARDERVSATRTVTSEALDDDEPVTDVEIIEEGEAAPDGQEPKRKKKKGKKKRRKSQPEFPVWVWWLVAGGVGTVGVFTTLLVLIVALKQEAMAFVIAMVVMMPISMVILIASMYISSALGGGIDFGDARVAIPKAAALLFVVNAVNLSPCCTGGYYGYMATLPLWIFGLMGLFKLDIWEARVVVIINWALNAIARYVALGLLLSAATHMQEHPEQYQKKKGPSAEDMVVLAELGAEFQYGQGADHPIVGIKLRGTKVKDIHLDRLESFTELEYLDLGGSCLTDGGLERIAKMTKLKEVVVAQTLVSQFGIAKLRQDRPDLKIIR